MRAGVSKSLTSSEEALPITIASGATIHIGTLRARKVPYYRLRVRIPIANCEPGDVMRISEVVVDPEGGSLFTPPLAKTRCGKDVLVTGYAPGTYRLLLEIEGRTRENRGTASIPFAVTDRSTEIIAPIGPGVTVDGVIVAAEGSKRPDFSKISIHLRPVDHTGSLDAEIPTPDSDAKFRVSYVRPIGHTVVVAGLGTTHYVKEIRYNGGLLSKGVVPLDGPAMAHALTIVVDDKVAAITGSVATGDGPVTRAAVIAVKWPWESWESISRPGRAQTDSTGRFQITGLAPGEYRVIAIRSIEDLKGMTFATMQRVMAAGMKVELNPSDSQNVALEPSDLKAR